MFKTIKTTLICFVAIFFPISVRLLWHGIDSPKNDLEAVMWLFSSMTFTFLFIVIGMFFLEKNKE